GTVDEGPDFLHARLRGDLVDVAVEQRPADVDHLLAGRLDGVVLAPFTVLPLGAAADALLDAEHRVALPLLAQARVGQVVARLDPEPGADLQLGPGIGEQHGHAGPELDARLVARFPLLGREGGVGLLAGGPLPLALLPGDALGFRLLPRDPFLFRLLLRDPFGF